MALTAAYGERFAEEPTVRHPPATGLDRVERRLRVLVAGTASDAHTWNLIFLQMFFEERGHRVLNLGPCVPDDLAVATCRSFRPDLLAIGSVNGHGVMDGARLIQAVRRQPDLARTVAIIGGKLDTTGGANRASATRLLAAGFDAVFADGADSAAQLVSFIGLLPRKHLR